MTNKDVHKLTITTDQTTSFGKLMELNKSAHIYIPNCWKVIQIKNSNLWLKALKKAIPVKQTSVTDWQMQYDGMM